MFAPALFKSELLRERHRRPQKCVPVLQGVGFELPAYMLLYNMHIIIEQRSLHNIGNTTCIACAINSQDFVHLLG